MYIDAAAILFTDFYNRYTREFLLQKIALLTQLSVIYKASTTVPKGF